MTTQAAEFTSAQWKILHSLMEEVVLKKDAVLIKEGSKDKEIYLLKEGSLDVVKKNHLLAVLMPGDWVGEIAALTRGQGRTATVRAKESCLLMKISLSRLKKHPDVYAALITSVSKDMASRLHQASGHAASLAHEHLRLAKMRITMGQFLWYVLLAIGCFFYLLKIFSTFHLDPKITSVVSIPLIFLLSFFLFLTIKKSHFPLSMYGLTLKNGGRAVLESLLLTIPLLLFLIAVKWALILSFPALHGQPLFNLSKLLTENLGTGDWLLLTLGYALTAPLQEMIVRGCLQGSFTQFLTSKHKTLMAILLSNFLFSVFHLQLSLEVAVIVFFVGCFWGWLYARQKTLLGVSLSHIIVGIVGGVVIGYVT